MNLVNNALLHGVGDRGTGTICVSTTTVDNETVAIKVSDDGVGMSELTVSRIFDPLYTTRLGRGGSGLGLSIVNNIVGQVLGGTVSVESELGQGSCFMLVLPREAPGISGQGSENENV